MVLDPYSLLGVHPNSTPQEVRKKYYAMASLCHPDRGGTNEDMQAVHNAYCYVRDQVALNREVTYEQVQQEFEDFCATQTSQPPRFVDIHHETFDEFNAAFEASERAERAFAEGGYEIEKSEAGLEYSDVEAGTVKNQFTRDVVVYMAPRPFSADGFARGVDGSRIDNYSCTVGSLHVSDYKEALAPSVEMEYDETLEDENIMTSFGERARMYPF